MVDKTTCECGKELPFKKTKYGMDSNTRKKYCCDSCRIIVNKDILRKYKHKWNVNNRKYYKEYREKNKNRLSQYKKNWLNISNNKERVKESRYLYRCKNIGKYKIYNNEYLRNRWKNCSNYRASKKARNNLFKVLKIRAINNREIFNKIYPLYFEYYKTMHELKEIK